MTSSRFTIGSTLPRGAPKRVVTASGEPDDHLRIVVLVAAALTCNGNTDGDSVLDYHAQQCLSAEVSWSTRVEIFRELVALATESATEPVVSLINVDGFPEVRWRSHHFERERADLHKLLTAYIAEGGFHSLQFKARRATQSPTGPMLPGLEEESFKGSDRIGTGVDWQNTFGPYSDDARIASRRIDAPLHPVVAALVTHGFITPTMALDMLSSGDEEDVVTDILFSMYENLDADIRPSACKLALLRTPNTANGRFGPLRLAPDADDVLALPPDHLTALHDAGVLQRIHADVTQLWMPPMIRRFLARRGRLRFGADTVREWQRRLAHEISSCARSADAPTADALEAHHHAVESGDETLALQTAHWYVADLRLLAYRLSREASTLTGDRARALYERAAAIYEEIVHKDPGDAYAWEYLAFNRLRACKDPFDERVLRGFRRAHRLEQGRNPLYWARLLGLRAQRGENVLPEFGIAMRSFGYQRQHSSNGRGDDDSTANLHAQNLLATVVLDGLKRSVAPRAAEQESALVEEYGDYLRLIADDQLRSAL